MKMKLLTLRVVTTLTRFTAFTGSIKPKENFLCKATMKYRNFF